LTTPEANAIMTVSQDRRDRSLSVVEYARDSVRCTRGS